MKSRFIGLAAALCLGACRAPSRSPPSGIERHDSGAAVGCADRLGRFREELSVAPHEGAWRWMNKDVPPVASVPLVRVGSEYRPTIRVTQADIDVAGNVWWPIDAFRVDHFRSNARRIVERQPAAQFYVQVNAKAPLVALSRVRDALMLVEQDLKRPLMVGLLFVGVGDAYRPYEIPYARAPWVEEEVFEIRRTERFDGMVPGFARRALRRAAPACPAGVEAGVAVTEMLDHDVTLEGALIDALTACDCSELDLDAFAGLVLGSIGYRNPYGYVRLATSPKAKHRIKVPLAGSMADIAAAWPTNAGDEAVWIDFE